MKRRQFISKAGLATAATISAPFLLPSGRLFAQTGTQLAKHVVYVLFAGGLRQQESVLQRYLKDSQGVNFEGNIMLSMLDGQQPGPNEKRVYGKNPTGGGTPGSIPLTPWNSSTLQSQGTLFPEVRFSKSGTGHYNGLTTVTSGNYSFAGLRNRPVQPTIFEYIRRHLPQGTPGNPGQGAASKVWFVGNGVGNSTQLLNYSDHPNYGPQYGANFIAPNVIFGSLGNTHLSNAKIYPEQQQKSIYEMKDFLDQSFQAERGVIQGIRNTNEERGQIKSFIRDIFANPGQVIFPEVTDNAELVQTAYACQVMKEFKPTLTMINFNTIDTCHSNFTNYLKAVHRCDHAVGFIWQFIEDNIPEMRGNTAIVIVPEHGRSLDPNPILDQNDWKAYDHNSDPNARRIFSMMAGAGVPKNLVIGSETNPVGDATDCVPTIAELLGIKNEVESEGLLDVDAKSMFDRI